MTRQELLEKAHKAADNEAKYAFTSSHPAAVALCGYLDLMTQEEVSLFYTERRNRSNACETL